METPEAESYFRDLYELGFDPSIPLEEKITQAISVGRDRLSVQYGVLSYTGEGEYEVIGSTIESGDYAAGTVYDVDTTWCRHVIDSQEILAVADAGDSQYRDDIAREETNLQCYIGAPILVDGEVYGTLCYSGNEPREAPFTDDEKRFVRLLSRWIGYELEREKHYATLDAQNERLDEFAGVLTHDLRNPLTAARGYTELVSERVADDDAEHLKTALASLDRMETLITETLALARDGADVGERDAVQLGTVAESAWATVQPEGTLVVESDREISADRTRLQQLFENLFRNADEHCGDTVTVTVRARADGFSVTDDGPGLPADIAGSLFDGNFDADGLGLGLLIVERVVSGHGWDGQVDVENGTQFTFTGVGNAANTVQQSPVTTPANGDS
ncbi:GAF domain-containing sensor histidine kinase [Halovenus salina]|uniref:GAF domain-containing sensor histidine kinase n=1 Tax=Halovenus salina TaxID=1510225 RepID=UPI002260C618|nr:GAF domain-containing sensor histidine kinase [Halovenus salina]